MNRMALELSERQEAVYYLSYRSSRISDAGMQGKNIRLYPKPVTYDILEQCIMSLYEDYMEVNSPLADVGCITIKSEAKYTGWTKRYYIY